MTRRPGIRVGILATVFLGSSVGAQRPDLSGVWTAVADSATARPSVATTGDAAFRRGDAGSGWASPLTITQQANRLIVEYQVFSSYDLQPPLRLAFALDGSPSLNTIMIGHSAVAVRSSAAWAGDALTLTTAYPGPPGPDGRETRVEVRQSLRLASPATLVIETTRGGILGAPAVTSRTTWSKRPG